MNIVGGGFAAAFVDDGWPMWGCFQGHKQLKRKFQMTSNGFPYTSKTI
jgi:hypothetical protein